ncbi:MAG: alkaline phosphatase family protein [Herpetosiphonaceae bacterium]|nr:alkaline phosphatase family protein [Herpetosiphonaceae bacterium]
MSNDLLNDNDAVPQTGEDPRRVSRRHFLHGIAATAGGVALSAALPTWAAQEQMTATLPPPETSGIKHVIVVMMENRSFDHYLGWLPGADGRQAGQTYKDAAGIPHTTYPLAPDYQGCGHSDPDHSFDGGRTEWNNGACDGWLRAGSNDKYAIGYYQSKDLAFLGSAAPYWMTCDRYFAAIMSETFPNRMYQHTGQTDRISNTLNISQLPTIWDRLAQHGISGRYYFGDLPFLALWGLKYQSISHSFETFLQDCAADTLPSVSFVDPRFLGEGKGTSNDDHPHADIRNGEAFMNQIYAAVTSSAAWPHTVLIFNFDEWGGFFEHVPPPIAPVPDAVPRTGTHDHLRGFRLPAMFVAPWAPRRYVSPTVYDHTSVLKLIEWRWNLPALTIRDQTANNPAVEFNFRTPDLSAPQFNVPPGPFGGPCSTNGPVTEEQWSALKVLAQKQGWPI